MTYEITENIFLDKTTSIHTVQIALESLLQMTIITQCIYNQSINAPCNVISCLTTPTTNIYFIRFNSLRKESIPLQYFLLNYTNVYTGNA